MTPQTRAVRSDRNNLGTLAGRLLSKDDTIRLSRRSALTGCLIFFFNAVVYTVMVIGAVTATFLPLRISFALLAGLATALLFIVGHDACHQSLTPFRSLNYLIGQLAFLPSLHPFSLWDLGHNRIHHRYTNLRHKDYVWRPLDPSEYRALRPFQRAIYRFYRSAAGPLGYYLCEIWWKKMFFPRSSDIGGYSLAYVRDLSIVVAGLALAITLAVDRSATNGALAGSLTMGLIVPFLVFNVLMSLVIYLHHTHPSVRWFGDERDWKAHTAQLDCTIHIVFPGPINVLFHRIMEHQAHHVQATIPLYRLQRAQETLARQHGSRVRQVRWTVREHLATVSACKLYDYQRHRWLDYEGAPTTGSSLSDAAPERSADESRAALTVSIAIFALLLPWGASAQGLALRGVGPVNRAMGGVATAAPIDAAGAIHWNPASIGGLPASEIRLGLELLDPETRVSSEIAPFALGPVPTATLAGSTRGRGGPIPSPSAAIVHRPTGSRWTFGLGVFGIAGVQINYPSSETNPYLRPQTPLPGTAPLPGLGRVVGRASYLQVAPTVSYAITDRLSIGIAPTPTLAQLEAMPLAFASPDDANGDGLASYPSGLGGRRQWGAGIQLGVFYALENAWRFGASVKSPLRFDEFKFVATDERGADRLLEVDFDYPRIMSVGASYAGVDDFLFAVDVRHLDYASTNGFRTAGFDASGAVTGLGWRSVLAVAAGTQYQATRTLALRVGYAYNENPVPDENAFFNVVSPLIVKHALSVGGSFRVTQRLSIDASFVRGLQNTISGPFHVPGLGPLLGVSSVSSDASANAFDIGLAVRY